MLGRYLLDCVDYTTGHRRMEDCSGAREHDHHHSDDDIVHVGGSLLCSFKSLYWWLSMA